MLVGYTNRTSGFYLGFEHTTLNLENTNCGDIFVEWHAVIARSITMEKNAKLTTDKLYSHFFVFNSWG